MMVTKFGPLYMQIYHKWGYGQIRFSSHPVAADGLALNDIITSSANIVAS